MSIPQRSQVGQHICPNQDLQLPPSHKAPVNMWEVRRVVCAPSWHTEGKGRSNQRGVRVPYLDLMKL